MVGVVARAQPAPAQVVVAAAPAQVVVAVAVAAPAQAGAVVPASEEVAVAAPVQAEAVVPALAEVAVRVARAQPERAQGPVAEVQPALAQAQVLTWLALAGVVKQLLESGFVRPLCWVVESDASDR